MPDPAAMHPHYHIDPLRHLAFARMIAHVVRDRFGFRPGFAEEAELEGVAYVTLCKHCQRFDRSRVKRGNPDEMLQGTSKRDIMTECIRAAEKLKKGGIRMLPPDDSAIPPPRCQNSIEVLLGLACKEEQKDEQQDDEPIPAPVTKRDEYIRPPPPRPPATQARSQKDWLAFVALRRRVTTPASE
jgi:hypothetical protein